MCANCKKSYLWESHLQAHVRSHLPVADRPLACAKIGCSKHFWMTQHPKVHIVSVHRGKKAFCVSRKLFRKVISRESQQPMGRSVLNRCTVVRTPSQKTTDLNREQAILPWSPHRTSVWCRVVRFGAERCSSVQSSAVRCRAVRCGCLQFGVGF